jgi:hypothetical protein
MIWKFKEFIKENLNNNTLIIVDVQRSFRKFFTEMYINELSKHCKNFNNVYLIWDNHHSKNVDNDYLYDKEPEIPISNEFYNFPNIKDRIEKRYNYDVNVDFYKKILDKEIYDNIKNLEEKNQLKKGDLFPTKEGTAIVYIGNKHRWFHVPKKLYDIFMDLKGQEVEILGGSSEECLLDVVTTGKSMGVIMKTNFKFVWSASHCPIK